MSAYEGTPVLASQVTAPEPTYSVESQGLLTAHPTYSRQLSHSSAGSQYASSMEYGDPSPDSRKRARHQDMSLDHGDFKQQLEPQRAQTGLDMSYQLTPGAHHAQPSPGPVDYHLTTHQGQQHPRPVPSPLSQSQTLSSSFQHHHHHLPDQPPPAKSARLDFDEPDPPLSPDRESTHVSVVGRQGMPYPAPRPKGPKLKFTPEDDTLLVELKETKNLTWKQIADFFPGRSSGTLQVRYCTKLKAKKEGWSGEMCQRLKTAIRDYDNERWRVIASRVGGGFSANACKEKAAEIDEEEHALEARRREEELEQTSQEPSSAAEGEG